MKRNNLMKLALISVAAGFCISGQVARVDNRETAMAKCTKTPDSYADEPGGESNLNSVSQPSQKNTRNTSQKRKSAAQRAMDLELYGTSANTEVRKSAAQRAMEETSE